MIRVQPSARLRGDIVDFRGRIQDEHGQTAVGAKGRVLVTDRLWWQRSRPRALEEGRVTEGSG